MQIKKLLLITTCLMTLQLSYSQNHKASNASDTLQIQKLLSDYATSVNNMDTILAGKVWSIHDNVSFIHPRGHEKGWQQVKNNFYIKTMFDTFSERKLDIYNITIDSYSDFAYVEFYWTFNAKLRNDGRPLTTEGRESQMLIKDKNGWHIMHIHYSGMPVTGQRQGF